MKKHDDLANFLMQKVFSYMYYETRKIPAIFYVKSLWLLFF